MADGWKRKMISCLNEIFVVLISVLTFLFEFLFCSRLKNELYKLRASVQILSVCCILYPHDCTSEINKYCLNQDWKGKMINCLNEILLF